MNNKNKNIPKEKIDRNDDLETLRSLLAFKGQYHNHKETMAHAAVLIQLAVVTALFNINFKKLCCSDNRCCVFVLYILLWLVISWYMCWQLKMRRIAQWQVDKILEAIQSYYCANKVCMYNFIKDKMRDIQKDFPKCKDCKKIIACFIYKEWWKGNTGEIILWFADIVIGFIAFLRIWSI